MLVTDIVYKELFAKVPIGLSLRTTDGQFIEVNDTLVQMLGYARDEFMQLTYWDIAPIDNKDQEALQLESLRDKGRYGPFEKEYLHKGGYRIPVLINSIVAQSDDGETLIWSMVENISDVRNTEKLLNKAQQMANIGHWNLDLVKNELIWSDETYRIFGLKPQEFNATYEAFVERIHPDDRDAVNNAYSHSVEVKEAYEIDHRVVRPDGEIRYVHERCEHRYDKEGNIIGSIGTVLDVTRQFESEQELREAKEKAEAANDAKSLFIANMSHELRTPMNAILGFSQMMVRDDNLTLQQQKNLSIINASGSHLLAMINEILDLSKIESGEIKVVNESFKLKEMLNEIRELMQLKAKEKHLSCNLNADEKVPKYVRSDQNKLRQVLINIIGNAVKFTEKGAISIDIRMADGHDSGHSDLLIDIADTGCGIHASMCEDIFKPFVQENMNTEGGTGLGLAITKKIIHLLGGSIWVESEVAIGSVFHLRIPIEKGNPADAVETNILKRVIGLEPGQKEFKVLVVDDVETNRVLSSLFLHRVGFKTKEASNGKEAIELFTDWKPDVILMDIRMSGMNGYEAIDAIRSLPSGDKVKIIVLSAHMIKDEHDEKSLHQSDGFIGKPFEVTQLFETIAKVIGVRYTYQGEATSSAAPIVPFDLSKIDEILQVDKTAIHSAALKGNGKELKMAIETIEKDFPSAAEHLKKLSEKYNFDAIVALMER